MKKQYQTLTIEFEEFITRDPILASVTIGDGDSTMPDDFGDLL